MARYNEILVGRFNRALQKLTGIKGGPPTPQLSGDLAATIAMGYGRECRYLESWDAFAQGINLSAQAALVNVVRFRNPLGSNIVAVIEKMDVSEGANDTMFVTNQVSGINADLTSVLGVVPPLDARSTRLGSSLVLSTQTFAAVQSLANGLWKGVISSTASGAVIIGFEDQEVPLLPGSAIQFSQNTVNIGVNVNVWWRERFLEDSERA